MVNDALEESVQGFPIEVLIDHDHPQDDIVANV